MPFRILLLLTLAGCLGAQTLTRQNLASILDFENSTADRFPTGWTGTAAGVVADSQIFFSGRLSARIERSATDNNFSTLAAVIPADFTAQTLEWKGMIRTESVRDFAALWLRVDGAPGETIAFATLQGTPNAPQGTAGWQEFSVRAVINSRGQQVVMGFLLSGPGKAWVDRLELLADGRPVAQAAARNPTPLETDTEFTAGSRLELAGGELSKTQVDNLAMLGKVWGFVKYHHPAVTQGQRHWDFDLFRVLPAVLASEDAQGAREAILALIDLLGPVPECSPCATLSQEGLYLAPDLDWIGDTGKLGDRLSAVLQTIHRNRTTGPQFYAAKFPGVGNPNVERELSYGAMRYPDAGYQLLALYRLWNAMQYFNPNRDIMQDGYDEPGDRAAASSRYWDRVLTESIPAFAQAKTRLAYQQELLKLIAKINDTHANLWSNTGARPPMGACQMPVDIRFVEGKPVVIRKTARPDTEGSVPLEVGDVIERLDGRPVEELVAQWRPYYAASNEPTRLRDIGNNLTRGACGESTVAVERAGGKRAELTVTRIPFAQIDFSRTGVHDLAGPAFQKPAGDIAYLKISTATQADAANYFQWAEGTSGLIIDIRNYPGDFPIFQIGGRLVSETTPFVRFTEVDLANPGAFHFRAGAALAPLAPRYPGKVVILVDEVTQSSAEYHTMAFRRAPGAVVIGSTTAGADGNVSTIPLPGAERTLISGIGVFYPDSKPTQRIGIVPDIEVKPTIAGIRAGRDELMEAAARVIRESAGGER